jgi:hypothetical protein
VKLSSTAFERLSEALSDAFSRRSEFELLARCIDKTLQDLVGPDAPRPAIVLALVECAETGDAVANLIECAQKQNTTNRLLGQLDPGQLEQAASGAQIVDAGGGPNAFKDRVKEALAELDQPGMEAVAGKELAKLALSGSDDEVDTVLLSVLGAARGMRPDHVVAELSPIITTCLRRLIAEGEKRPEGLAIDLTRARLRRIDLSSLDLHEADLAFADLRHADLTNANLWRSRGYGVNVTKAGLSRSNLEECRWHAAVAHETRFHDCRMVSAFLKDAQLVGAQFQRSRLQGAHFDRADLTGARFEQADIADAFFRDATIDAAAVISLSRAKNWQEARFDQAIHDLIAGHATP